MEGKDKRAVPADLVIISEMNRGEEDKVDIAVEFKYEPSHHKDDRVFGRPFTGSDREGKYRTHGILKSDLPVVTRNDFENGVRRINSSIEGKTFITMAENAYAVVTTSFCKCLPLQDWVIG